MGVILFLAPSRAQLAASSQRSDDEQEHVSSPAVQVIGPCPCNVRRSDPEKERACVLDGNRNQRASEIQTR